MNRLKFILGFSLLAAFGCDKTSKLPVLEYTSEVQVYSSSYVVVTTKVSGNQIEKLQQQGVVYSENPQMLDVAENNYYWGVYIKVSSESGELYRTILNEHQTNIYDSITYYFKPFSVWDGQLIYGDVDSFKLPPTLY